MTIETWWMNASPEQRLYVLKDCDWRTLDGRPNRTARSASRKPWAALSPAMTNILTRKAAEGTVGL